MQIRTRLTLQFLLLGVAIMIVSSFAIYYSSAVFRRDDFGNRLFVKARSTANLVFDKAEIDAKKVLQIENDSPVFLQNEKIIILNFNNDTVYNSDENSDIRIRNDIVEKVRQGYDITYKQNQYEVVCTMYYTSYDRFVIITGAIDTEGARHLEKLKMILMIVCLFSFLLFFAAGWFFSGKALKPISEVVKRVEDISISSLHLRVNEGNGTDEIGKLAKTFNSMLQRLEISFSMQKNFIANASHELRTPLTAINGQLEVLLMKDRSTDDYKTALEPVLDDIRALIDLLNRLLLVARTSSDRLDNYRKNVRIDEILWQVREEITRFKKECFISISIDDSITDAELMIVRGDEYMLKVAVSNIIDNACKYSPDHTCAVLLRYITGRLEVQFSDHGIGIEEKEIQKVFDPFFRGTNTHSIPGSGIGLQLVSQIIRNHNGTIGLSSQAGKGTNVTISFPITA